jgi:hypothetical protein
MSMFSLAFNGLRRNHASVSSWSRHRSIRLEVELLEPRHLLSSAFFVPMSPIATGLGGDITSAVGDFNGDGRLDVLSTSSQTVFQEVDGTMRMVPRHTAVWYENDGAAVPSFTPHTIAVANSDIPWVGVGDIDGNGTLDAVMEIDGNIYWYGNNGDGTVWTPHLVPGAQGDLSVWIADVMGNGHNDLILPYGNTITWWENVKGDGTKWVPHVISDQVTPSESPPPPSISVPGRSISAWDGNTGSGTDVKTGTIFNHQFLTDTDVFAPSAGLTVTPTGLAVSVVWGRINILSVGDINGDGKLDVISSGDGSIQWWENPGSVDGTWVRHIVHQGGLWSGVRMAFAEDINGDGKLDIISSGFGDVSWWENTAGDGSTWVRHTITSGDWNAESITVGDINGDGHPDLFSFAPMSSVATWFENDGAANPSFTPHTLSFPTGPGTVSLGDLNGDGRLDAVITPEFSNSIDWFMNWDGQSPLPTSNPPPANSPPISSSSAAAVAAPIPGFAHPLITSGDSVLGVSDVTGFHQTIHVSSSGILTSSIAVISGTATTRAGGAFAQSGQLSVHAMGAYKRSMGLEDETDISSAVAMVRR